MSERSEEVESLVAAIRLLPEPGKEPDGYPGSLALCVLDSIYSLGIRYEQVENLVARYRENREEEGSDAGLDTPQDLINVIDRVGGPAEFAEYVNNRTRTSSSGGVLKAEAVMQAAQMLVKSEIESPSQLHECAKTERMEVIEARWCKVRGQSSGISWDYFQILAGLGGVKADRMIIRFCERVLDRQVSSSGAHDLIVAASGALAEEPSEVDYKIWCSERERAK